MKFDFSGVCMRDNTSPSPHWGSPQCSRGLWDEVLGIGGKDTARLNRQAPKPTEGASFCGVL